MMVYVDDERCVGCGVCLEACPADALKLIGEVAAIDQGKCRGCGACMEDCPTGAILSVTEPDTRELSLPTRGNVPASAATQPARVSVAGRTRKALPWLGTALAFVGRQVVPRLADVLLDAWDRRARSRTGSSGQSLSTSPQPAPRMDESLNGRGHQFRHRGGRS